MVFLQIKNYEDKNPMTRTAWQEGQKESAWPWANQDKEKNQEEQKQNLAA